MKIRAMDVKMPILCWAVFLAALLPVVAGAQFGVETNIYHHFDAQGSLVASTDSAGNVLYRERYAPYGARERNEPAGTANSRWFTGYPADIATGLLYAGGRWYDPQIGRFLGVDPKGITFTNLQSLNRYAYGNNNPYRYVDPDGNIAETVADVISLGLSINSFLQEPSLFNALGVAVDAVGTAVPFLPAGFGTIRAVGRGIADIPARGVQASKTAGDVAEKTLVGPGRYAGDSIPARSSSRDFTKGERVEIDRIGSSTGCHTCGAKSPGTKSGHFVPDHQPPSALNQSGGPQRLYPQCINCSREQGLAVARELRKKAP